MRLVDARAALHSRSGKSLARRRELGHQHPISRKDLIAIVWRDHRSHGLVRRKEGVAWANGLQHSPAPVDGPWRYVLGTPDRGLLKFDPPSPPAGDIPDCPTIARKKFPKLYVSKRYGEGESKTIFVYGSRGDRIIEPPVERQGLRFARGAPRWKPGPHKPPKPPIYAQRPWRIRLTAPSSPEMQITLRFEPWPMAVTHTQDVHGPGCVMKGKPIPVLMRDELGAGFHVIRPIGMEHPSIIRRPGRRAIYSPAAWAILWSRWDATPKPPYLRQIWAVTSPAGKVVNHRNLGEIFEASSETEEVYLGRCTTGIDPEEYSPHGERGFRRDYGLRQWERARAEESAQCSDYRRRLPVIRRVLRQERLDHGHMAEQRRLADLRALFREHELLLHPNLLAFTDPYRRYAYRGGPLDRDLGRWVEAVSRKVASRWGLDPWDQRIEDLAQEGWIAALKAQRCFTPGRDTWKAYSALAISRACWAWLRWQSLPVTISQNRKTYKNDREAGFLPGIVDLDAAIAIGDGETASLYQMLGEAERADYVGGPTWREAAALLGGVDGAKKRASMVLEGDELRVMLGRLQGIALEKLAIQLGIPPSTVHDIEKRAARRMLEKMEPMMAMIDFGFNAAGKDQPPERRRVAKPR
jgi:DNA-directed RNA polymerase specialized sigma24 family protein